MRRLSAFCAAAGMALAALAATSPAEAAFHLIRYHDSGFCQVLDDSIPVTFPTKYMTVSHRVPTFVAALAVKDHLMHRGTCKF
jgi:hypothetical protein